MTRSRKFRDGREALMEIGKLEDENCRGCKIKTKLRKDGLTHHEIQNHCTTECKIGKRIRALGGIIEYGAEANFNFKASELTKEVYLELREGISDMEIRERFDISKATLTRRKHSWGLNTIREYIIPHLALKNVTPKELRELANQYTDKEIAVMFNVHRSTIQKRRKEWGILKGRAILEEQFTLGEYYYLSKNKKLKDWEVCELWDISTSSLLILKKRWGIAKPRNIHKPHELEAMGLTKEKMLELVPNNSDTIIADMYGLHVTTVTKHRKRLGISHLLRLPKNRIKPERIKELMDQGLKVPAMANILEIHRDTLYDMIKEFKEKNLL